MRVTVFGGEGFIGQALCRELADTNVGLGGNYVRSVDLAVRNENPFWSHYFGDVECYDDVAASCETMTHVVHMASVAGVDAVLANKVKTMLVNTRGTINVLQAAYEKNIFRVVYFSTSEVMGSMAYRLGEDMATSVGPAIEGRWTYAISKLSMEHLCRAYTTEVGIDTVCVRPFNVFGPGQIGVGAVKTFIGQALKDEPLIVWNGGDEIRSWCYINDMIDATHLALTEKTAKGQVFNVGNPKNTITVYQLAKLIKTLTKSNSKIISRHRDYEDVKVRVPNIERARRVLGFEPRWSLEDGLMATIETMRTT